MDTWHILIATAGTYLLAGFIKGVIGLGLPTVAVGLLGLMMSPAHAAAILVVPSLVTNVWQGFTGGAISGLLRRLAPLLIGICIGTLIGAVWLPPGSSQGGVWLGVLLVLYAALCLVNIHFVVPPRHETWVGVMAGIVNGVLAVATGVFVIPGVPYIQALKLERDRMVQALGLSFTVSTIALALALAHAGEMAPTLLWPSLVALIAAIIGMVVGQLVRGLVKAATFRVFFFAGLLLLGAHLALRGLL